MEVIQQVIPRRNQVRQPDYYDMSPPGCRFHPTDAELILFYLKEKIETGKHPECRLYEVNLYDYNPQELTAKDEYRGFENETWYFLTPRERKHGNGNRSNRITKDFGCWKATQKNKNVYENERSSQVIGTKSTLEYYDSNKNKTEWRMYEYTTVNPNFLKGSNAEKLTELVLCKVYKIKKTIDRRNQAQQEDVQNARNQEHNDQPIDEEPSPRRRRLSVDQQNNEMNEHTNHHQAAFVLNSNSHLVQSIDTSGINLPGGGFGHNHGSVISTNPISMQPIAAYDSSNVMANTREHQGSEIQQVIGSSTYGYYQNQFISTIRNGSQFSIVDQENNELRDVLIQHANHIDQAAFVFNSNPELVQNINTSGINFAGGDFGHNHGSSIVSPNSLSMQQIGTQEHQGSEIQQVVGSSTCGYYRNQFDPTSLTTNYGSQYSAHVASNSDSTLVPSRDVVQQQHGHNVNQDTQITRDVIENGGAASASDDDMCLMTEEECNEMFSNVSFENDSSMDPSLYLEQIDQEIFNNRDDVVEEHFYNVNQDTQITRVVLDNVDAPAAAPTTLKERNKFSSRFSINEDQIVPNKFSYEDTQIVPNVFENDASTHTEDLNESLVPFDNEDPMSWNSFAAELEDILTTST